MESKLLNLQDALVLASVLNKYIDTESISKEQTSIDFIGELLEKIEPLDYVSIVRMLTKETTEKISKMGGKDLLEILYSGLEKNRILSLLDTYKKVGFV